jgi:four helix bundle protein
MRIAECGLELALGGELNRIDFKRRAVRELLAIFGQSQFAIRNPQFMKKELEARTKLFALSVIRLVGKLPRGKASEVIGYQLLKSGTSIGANYREVNRAQSHDDFIHKVAICEKEAAETEYWLELAMEANLTTSASSEELLREVRELLAIFVASGRTAKSRR